jgi:hypothetical protein
VKHLSQEQLEALVMGLASGRDDAIHRHLATCGECARRLAREAQFERDLYEAAALLPDEVEVARAPLSPARPWRAALAVAAAMAVVAFGAWLLLPRPPTGGVHAPVPVAGTPPAPRPCIEDPTRLGPGACALPAQDVCRYVVVEKSRGPSF